jgi:MarR family transcriptional regulator for hemolysin
MHIICIRSIFTDATESRLQSLGFLIHNAATQLRREFERAARPYGLTLMQWRVLAASSKDEGQSQSSIGTRLDASPMTVSDVLERMEAGGLVTRETDPADSRAKLVRTTDEGQRLLSEMRVIADRVYQDALAGIDDVERAALVRALTKISANLEGESGHAKEKIA